MVKYNFGEYLRLKRKEKGVTLKKLGKLMGLSHSFLSQIETEVRGIPNTDTLYKLCDILELDEEEFLVMAGRLDLVERMKRYQREGFSMCHEEGNHITIPLDDSNIFLMNKMDELAEKGHKAMNESDLVSYNSFYGSLRDCQLKFGAKIHGKIKYTARV